MQNCKANEKQNSKGSEGSESSYTCVLFELRDQHQRHWDLIRCAHACVRACLHTAHAHATGPIRLLLNVSRCRTLVVSVFLFLCLFLRRLLHNYWKGLAWCSATATAAARTWDAHLSIFIVCANKKPASARRGTIFIYSSLLAKKPRPIWKRKRHR